MRHPWLYAGVLGALVVLVGAAAGNGILDRPHDWSDWQYRAFRGVCHQLPERSFHVNGVPMAVNARCFGIFSGLLAGWLLIPPVAARLRGMTGAGAVLAVAILVHIVDFTAGQFAVWNSSNFSRFFLGIFLGIAFAIMLADRFIQTTNTKS